MIHPNGVIGSTMVRHAPGKHTVMMRRIATEEYREVTILVLRETTWTEYRDWHVREGLPYEPKQLGEYYYEFLMD